MKDLAVYIHWPFCLSKCPYCDFNSKVLKEIDEEQWKARYRLDLQFYAEKLKERQVSSIYFGGGTPSLMSPALVEALLSSVQAHWPIKKDCEITIEANPTSVEISKLKAFKEAGVNRLSLGVQALDDKRLDFLGRAHTKKEALDALESAQNIFDRYSFDLIYGTGDQSFSDWEKELKAAMAYVGDHISVYQLTIEEKTPFAAQYKKGTLMVLQEETLLEMYSFTRDFLEAQGLPFYEISNYAKQGCESRHNLSYWHYDEYIGIGPGAHGRVVFDDQKCAVEEHKNADIWLKGKARQITGLSASDRGLEALLMGLRLREGVSLSRLEEETGQDWQNLLDMKHVAVFQAQGDLEKKNGRLRATRSGLLCLDTVLAYLVA